MIADNLKNCHKYYESHKGFDKAFEFIKKAAEENLPVGRYEIDGDNVFASVQEYTSNLEENGKFEGHRNYIDIQHILCGTEVMDVMDLSKARTKTAYDSSKDIEFFENNPMAGRLVLQEGEYAVFFPWDIHKPGLCFNGKPDSVRKIVVKVKF